MAQDPRVLDGPLPELRIKLEQAANHNCGPTSVGPPACGMWHMVPSRRTSSPSDFLALSTVLGYMGNIWSKADR
jgi:hypothetical protein